VWFEFESSLIKSSFNRSSKKESIRSLLIKVQVCVLGSVSPTAATSLVALVVYWEFLQTFQITHSVNFNQNFGDSDVCSSECTTAAARKF